MRRQIGSDGDQQYLLNADPPTVKEVREHTKSNFLSTNAKYSSCVCYRSYTSYNVHCLGM